MAIIYIRKDSWILKRMGEELKGVNFKGTYFINYPLHDARKPRPHGAFFTHLEPKWHQRFDEVASRVDFAVCMNKKIKQYLENIGVKTEIIYPGHDPRIKKKPVFGFSGRFYKSGRKGEDLLEGMEYYHSQDFEKQPEFYKKIDYLLITARIEGGPMPVLDAIAAGVPVIARKGLGWCDEFPAIRYETDEEFKQIINQLNNPPTWEEWRKKHQELFLSVERHYRI